MFVTNGGGSRKPARITPHSARSATQVPGLAVWHHSGDEIGHNAGETISEADVERVTKEMSRCSDFEHDESGAVHADPPEPDIIEADIKNLDD